MTIAASVTNESSPATPNDKPVSDKITNPDSSIIPSTATEKQAQREAKYNKSRNDIHDTLTAYGPNGRATNDTGPDGKQNRPGRAERDWSSSRPNHNFVDAYISGPMEARRRLRLKQGSLNPRDLHTTFDYNAYREAEAILAAWDGRTKWTEKGVGTGCWQPLPASSYPEGLITPKSSLQARVEPPSVSLELIEAITPRTVKLSKAEERQQANNPAKPKLIVTDDYLQARYKDYAHDPANERGNLMVGVMAYAQHRFFSKLKNRYEWLETSDVISDFAVELMSNIEAGKYSQDKGPFSNWLVKCWINHLADFRREFGKEKARSVRLDNRDRLDKDGKHPEADLYVNPMVVDEEQYKRENAGPYLKHSGYDNSPKQWVETIMRDLDDPTTRFGQLDADMKAIIRELWKGNSVTEVGKSVGLGRRQVDRKLKALRELKLKALRERKSHSFLHVSPNHLMHTDDVVKGGRLYTVSIEDFEREVAR